MTLSSRLLSRFTDQELVDHLVYSGAEYYDWYVSLEDTPNSIVIAMDDPNANDGVITTELTFEQVRKGICQMLDDEKEYYGLLSAVTEHDFDADIADIILQHLCLGSVVYG